jgi:hypothetical protein
VKAYGRFAKNKKKISRDTTITMTGRRSALPPPCCGQNPSGGQHLGVVGCGLAAAGMQALGGVGCTQTRSLHAHVHVADSLRACGRAATKLPLGWFGWCWVYPFKLMLAQRRGQHAATMRSFCYLSTDRSFSIKFHHPTPPNSIKAYIYRHFAPCQHHPTHHPTPPNDHPTNCKKMFDNILRL